jgi:group II intron reverse transcriptase/maturase
VKTKGHEESDGRVVPTDGRKADLAAAGRHGKATTASKQAAQLELLSETADSPQGAVARAAVDRSAAATSAVPKSENTTDRSLPAMTMEEVADRENLRSSFERVAANDGAPGADRQSVAEVREHLDAVIERLHRELTDGSYRPGLIRRVWIPKSGGGQRGLGIPNVVDRIVQQAVHQVLGPHYEPTFHTASHGFRPERSCHTAIAAAIEHVAAGNEWVVDIDLEKFFDRVHHDRLLARLAQRISDQRLLLLIRRMLKARVVMPDGVVVSTKEGTPQGGPLSPLLSNIVLDELDCELDRRGHRFVRYADDCNIYVRSERSGHRVMRSVTEFIERRLRLKVNREKSAVARTEERHFVGFSLRREPLEGDVEVLLSRRSKHRIDDRIVELTPRMWGRSLKECILRLNRYLLGWFGFFGIVTDCETLEALDAHVRRRLRAIVLRHWKTKRTMIVRLRGLGVRQPWVRRWLMRWDTGWWNLTRNRAVRTGLRNAYFADRGLVSLRQRWAQHHVIAPPVSAG